MDVMPTDIIIEGVAGSRAFGLSTDDSDFDLHGVYRVPLNDVLGLNGPAVVTESYVVTSVPYPYGTAKDKAKTADISLHEVGKFVNLALKCNPTVLETLWLGSYTRLTVDGSLLVNNKHRFLYDKGVRGAYGGYAHAQVKKLMYNENTNLTPKLGRHAFRLLFMGQQLLEKGDMNINVGDFRDYFFAMGEMAVNDPDEFMFRFTRSLEVFDNTESVLPERPDREFFATLLPHIRLNGEGL